MRQQNWNKPKINLPLNYDGHPGVRHTQESGQVSVDDIRAELKNLGITEDVYELLDAAPCEERYGMLKPGFDSRINLVTTKPAWGMVFGWNNVSDLWAVVNLNAGDGQHTLLRMSNGGMGTIVSFHSSEESAHAAMTAHRLKTQQPTS